MSFLEKTSDSFSLVKESHQYSLFVESSKKYALSIESKVILRSK